MKAIRKWVLNWLFGRKMKVEYITNGEGSIYLTRHFVIPRNRWLNVYFHQFVGNDNQRFMHDHPWWSFSWVLSGSYLEHCPNKRVRRILEGALLFRPAKFAHRITLTNQYYCATLFITGPKVREWGFHTLSGWKHWTEYLKK